MALPPDLLHAAAERRRRIALVIGAGCSLEHPTNLQLARVYADEAHRQLVEDGVLTGTDCPDPTDLSAVASAVLQKTGYQEALVLRLPRHEFRMAQPNAGYLVAAALLREAVLDAVLTLNFDVALTSALVQLGATDVDIVPGPFATAQFGPPVVIYLHRSVEELDLEQWILTTEALEREWRDGWEEVVARRVVACPVVVFAGLGSPAAVLTESITRVRGALSQGQHQVYVVDPSATTPFKAALNLPDEAHLRTGWCAFMAAMEARVLTEFKKELASGGLALCDDNGWSTEADYISQLSERLHSIGLVALGKLRASWLNADQPYTPDSAAHRIMIADLLLGVGLVERALTQQARFREDGIVELTSDGIAATTILPITGGGTLRWSALEAKVLKRVERIPLALRPLALMVSGVVGTRSTEIAPPEDLIDGSVVDDIVEAAIRPKLFSVDEIRADASLATQMVA